MWTLGYNAAMIPLASLGLLQPVLAAGTMAFSSVSVLSNSLLSGGTVRTRTTGSSLDGDSPGRRDVAASPGRRS